MVYRSDPPEDLDIDEFDGDDEEDWDGEDDEPEEVPTIILDEPKAYSANGLELFIDDQVKLVGNIEEYDDIMYIADEMRNMMNDDQIYYLQRVRPKLKARNSTVFIRGWAFPAECVIKIITPNGQEIKIPDPIQFDTSLLDLKK